MSINTLHKQHSGSIVFYILVNRNIELPGIKITKITYNLRITCFSIHLSESIHFYRTIVNYIEFHVQTARAPMLFLGSDFAWTHAI